LAREFTFLQKKTVLKGEGSIFIFRMLCLCFVVIGEKNTVMLDLLITAAHPFLNEFSRKKCLFFVYFGSKTRNDSFGLTILNWIRMAQNSFNWKW
jgi:hypothetical protein